MPVAYRYLNIQSLILLIFVLMMLMTQIRRSRDPGQAVRNPSAQIVWLSILFVVLSLGFGVLLMNISPLMAVELAAGFTLSLLHPANALCFFIHLFYLRPWEIVDTNPCCFGACRRLLIAWCFFSWILHPRFHGKPSGRTFRQMAPLLAFSAWVLLATFVAHAPEAQSDFRPARPIVFVMSFFQRVRALVSEMTITISTVNHGRRSLSFFQKPVEEARLEFQLAGRSE